MLKTTKTELAKKLGISRQSFYYKPKQPPFDKEDKNKIVPLDIRNNKLYIEFTPKKSVIRTRPHYSIW